MKYKFITVLHNLKLENVKNKGVSLFQGARISNGSYFLKEILETKLMGDTLGFHSKNEFKNKVYFYIEGEFKDIHSINEMNEVGSDYTFFFLRQIQRFLDELWAIKDNNVYVRDGFLVAYDKNFEAGRTYKASLSAIFTRSTLDQEESLFNDEELKLAVNNYEALSVEESKIADIDYKGAKDDYFFKHSKSERTTRALYFVLNARASSILPMKIMSYCTALECLFTSSKTEVNHRIAERTAQFLGSNLEDKKELYKLVKKAYDIRSTIVHGSSLKGKSEDLKDISKKLDDILRKLLVEDNDIFSKNDTELEEFCIDLVLSNPKNEVV